MRTLFSFLAAMVLLVGAITCALAKNPTVISAGSLTATGAGMAHVRIFDGSATVTVTGRLRVSAAATVTITSGSAGTEVDKPNKKTGKGGWVVYKKFNGTATITGQDVHVFAHGKSISVSATGDGRAHMIGTGTFSALQAAGGTALTGTWATKPAKTATAADKKAFEKSIRVVFGTYEFKDGKIDTDGEAEMINAE